MTEGPVAVSIVVPTHDREQRLSELLDSLSRTTVPPGERLEVIVVQDACSDGTAEMLRRVAETFIFPLRIIESQAASVSQARNLGAREARGEVKLAR